MIVVKSLTILFVFKVLVAFVFECTHVLKFLVGRFLVDLALLAVVMDVEVWGDGLGLVVVGTC